MRKRTFELFDRPIAFHRCFVRITHSVDAALMLSQAMYWSDRTSDDEGWFYKSQKQWEDETGLSRSEQEVARKTLRSCGFWQEKLAGVPATLYFRVDCRILQTRLQGFSILVCENPQTRLQDSANITSSEITSETTTEITHKEKRAKDARPTKWPEGFRLDADLENFASRKGLQGIEEQWAKFEDYHRSKGSKFEDWRRAWHTWVRNALDWGKNGNGKRAESFSERNVRETTELCDRIGERAEEILRKVAKGVPESSNGASVPSLFRGLIGPES